MKRFFHYFLRRVRSQKALSGVIIALLLVLIGVGLVAGIGTWLNSKKTDITNQADTTISNVISESSNNNNNNNNNN